MHPSADLRLVLTSLKELSATPYFDQRVLEYSNNLCRAIEFALKTKPVPPIPTLRALARAVWLGHAYLSGSISREAPYEVQYCLSRALEPWTRKDKPFVITTALLHGQYDFHLHNADPWELITKTMPGFDKRGFNPALVLIGLPRLYRHKPIFCMPLYHELGHFIDRHWGITDLAVLRARMATRPNAIAGVSPPHWREHFADVFAATYVGEACTKALQMIAPEAGPSASHPSTNDRLEFVRRFLGGCSDERLTMIQESLSLRGAPRLEIRFEIPDIKEDFDDLRPHRVTSEAQLHGLFAASWEYFECSLRTDTSMHHAGRAAPEDQEGIINDLTEKSIRNYAIRRMWADGKDVG